MKPASRAWGLPLLSKELTELAARRRTYIVRFVYGAVLFAGGLLILYGRTRGEGSTAASLGHGREMFHELVLLQFGAILVFLPAMTAAALTLEKERDTLTLLLLTTLRPWAILAQKLLSRLIPMVSYIILAFPLLAVAYSYGGVTTDSLLVAMFMLLVCVLQTGCLALMCSAYCRTTVEALIATYALLFGTWMCVPVCIPLHTFWDGFDVAPAEVPARTALALMTCIGSLIAARVFLETRAFVPPRNVLLQLFQALDRMFNEWNQVTGGVILVRDGSRFPEDRPIAWRETAKKSLGTFRYLFRVLVVLEVPILFVAQSVNVSAIQSRSAVSMLLYVLWCIAIAMICVHAASVVSSERSRQTLELLLIVPLSGRDLLRQKLAGVRRLIRVLLVPFVTIFLFHHWFRDHRGNLAYLALSLATTAVFLPLTMWVAAWIGLTVRSQVRAVFCALAVVGALIALPQIVEFVCDSVLPTRLPELLTHLLRTGPVGIVERLEAWHRLRRNPSPVAAWIEAGIVITALSGYAVALWLIRRHCLRYADRLLGRVTEAPASAAEPAPTVEGSLELAGEAT
jgi:ABC-type transport system involved in multi-copper enzyme maturation permease subunit